MEPMEIVQLLGNLGEFLGAFAVFATLLYLAIQVRDAGKASQFAAVQANRAQRIATFDSLRDSPYFAPIQVKLQAGEDLNAEEQIRQAANNASTWALLYSEWVQRELGVMGEFATKDELPLGVALLTPSTMDWWRMAGAGIFPARFVEYVNKAAAAHETESGGVPGIR